MGASLSSIASRLSYSTLNFIAFCECCRHSVDLQSPVVGDFIFVGSLLLILMQSILLERLPEAVLPIWIHPAPYLCMPPGVKPYGLAPYCLLWVSPPQPSGLSMGRLWYGPAC